MSKILTRTILEPELFPSHARIQIITTFKFKFQGKLKISLFLCHDEVEITIGPKENLLLSSSDGGKKAYLWCKDFYEIVAGQDISRKSGTNDVIWEGTNADKYIALSVNSKEIF